MEKIIDLFKNNLAEIFAVCISVASLIISCKRYKVQLATITKDFDIDSDYKFRYKAQIVLKNSNEQIEIIRYNLFKKHYFIYRKFQFKPKFKIKYKNPIIGEQILDLQDLQNLPEEKYKLIFYMNRQPKKLRIKFTLPYDGFIQKSLIQSN